ncbi:MAG: hypothetical protein VXZ82_15040 [Planctomycetota bacterium]|nr:hypothetical protein [Planctomycetota bacterium]
MQASLHQRKLLSASGRMLSVVLFATALIPIVERVFAQNIATNKQTPTRPLQSRWEVDPNTGVLWGIPFGRGPRRIDLEAILSEDMEQSVARMQQIVLDAKFGFQNRSEALEVVLQQLDSWMQGQIPRPARLAALSAATTLTEGLDEAESVWSKVETDSMLSRAAEPTLVKWKSKVALQRWRERLKSKSGDLTDQLTAIDGIGATGDSTDKVVLENILFGNGTPLPIRLASAKALGNVISEGLEASAFDIRENSGLGDLLAANILAKHRSPNATSIAESILSGKSKPARLVAFRIIAAADQERGLTLAADLIEDPQAEIRRAALGTLQQSDTIKHVNRQAIAMSDSIPSIREQARLQLEEKSQNPGLRETVDEIVSHHLKSDRWEGIEQAIRLCLFLNDSSRVDSLLQFLDHPRPEVRLWASWAMQELDQTPESLDSILKYCQSFTERIRREDPLTFPQVLAASFLFEALGVNRYKTASGMFELYVPKNDQKMRTITRTSAVYALGLIWEQEKNAKLAAALVKRLTDDGLNPEADTVRYASAISISRIGTVDLINDFSEVVGEPTEIGVAAEWAAEHLKKAAK